MINIIHYTLGLSTVLYTFLAIIVEADNMDESVEDITAALMAPRPKKATQVGVRYCRHRGKTKLVSATSLSADGAGPKKRNFLYVLTLVLTTWLETF